MHVDRDGSAAPSLRPDLLRDTRFADIALRPSKSTEQSTLSVPERGRSISLSLSFFRHFAPSVFILSFAFHSFLVFSFPPYSRLPPLLPTLHRLVSSFLQPSSIHSSPILFTRFRIATPNSCIPRRFPVHRPRYSAPFDTNFPDTNFSPRNCPPSRNPWKERSAIKRVE